MFFVLALLVIAPIGLGINVATSGRLDVYEDEGWLGFVLVFGLMAIVAPALVTAVHVLAVQDIASGRRPRIGHAVATALRSAPRAGAAAALYLLAVLAGLIALILPGIWIGVKLYFGVQAAVAERLGPIAALGRSATLTHGSWWRAFVVLVLTGVATWVLDRALWELLADTVASSGAWTAAEIAVSALLQSLTALIGTLLYFDLRTRQVRRPR